MEIGELVEKPHEEEEEEQVEMEQLPGERQMPIEDEFQSILSLVFQSPPHVTENFSEPAECSKGNTGNKEIKEMLVSMKRKWRRERKSGNNNRE